MLSDGETEGDVLEQPIEGAELADELRDEPQERPSVREALEDAIVKHGGELPEDRKRDRAGRFEKPAKDKQPVEATDKGAPGKADKANTVPGATPETGGAKAAPQSSPAPNGWTAEAKAEWGKLPPAVQAAVTKREADMTAGAKQLQDRYGGLHQIVQRTIGPAAQRYGQTPDVVLSNAMSWFDAIERNPAAGLAELARTYNVDLSKLGAAAPAPAGGQSNGHPPADPRIDHLMRTVTGFEERARQQALEAELSAWSATKPHFKDVRQVMAQIVSGATQMQDTSILTDDGAKVDLDKVYDKALWMVPEVRDKLLKEKAAQERKDREAQLAKARQAGSSVRPGTPGSGSLQRNEPKKPAKGETVRETIKRTWNELRS